MYAGIDQLVLREGFAASAVCDLLEASRSGFYAWRTRPPSAAEQRREELTREVRRIHAEVRQRCGSPRMHAELVARGQACSVNFVAGLMRQAGISAKAKRRGVAAGQLFGDGRWRFALDPPYHSRGSLCQPISTRRF